MSRKKHKPIRTATALTPGVRRALLILRDEQPYNAATFAEKMWPTSIMHRMVSNTGNGATRGKAAWLCAGSYLGRLEKMGLVEKNPTWQRRSNQEPVAYLTVLADTLLKQEA